MRTYKSYGRGDQGEWCDSGTWRWGTIVELLPDAALRVLPLSGLPTVVLACSDFNVIREAGSRDDDIVPASDHILDPTDPFDNALIGIVKTNRAKRKDYTSGDAGIFENFERAADETGLTVDQVIRVMIAIKNARLKALLGREDEALHEAVEDTELDCTVYRVILRAWRLQETKETGE